MNIYDSSSIPGPYPPGQSAQVLRMGTFNHAHHFVMNNPNVYDVTQNIQFRMGSEIPQVLVACIMEGAEFDSSERDPPPRCHPDTRQDIIQTILGWRHDNTRARKALWLNGPAGVGKSAIIQTLAESESNSPRNLLGATLFFSRHNKRNDPGKVLATIAYQLAVKNLPYRSYVSKELAADPRLLRKSMSEQFRLLITRPFGELMIWKGPNAWSVYLDGLDECDGESMQCKLVELISEFTLRFPNAPLVWIIASRSESHFQTLFSRGTIQHSHNIVTIPVNSSKACQDVERFLRKGFSAIRANHPDLFPSSSSWPTENQFLEIAWAASGLFVFASTVIRFIGINSMYGDPVFRLRHVLAVIRKAKLTTGRNENPLSTLDALYTQIMSTIEPSTLSFTKQILGFSIYAYINSAGSLVTIANVLGLEQHIVYNALQRLYSLIDVPRPNDAPRMKIKILHASFSDYLQDPERSREYAIDLTEFNTMVWRGYSRILWQANEDTRGIDAVTLSWPNSEWTGLSFTVLRARTFWAQMLMSANEQFRMYSKYFRASIPTSELLEVFEKISFDRLELYVSVFATKHFIEFLIWMRYHCPPELRNRLLTEEYQAPLALCTRILSRISKDKNSYEIVYWHSEGVIRWELVGLWGQVPVLGCPDVQQLGPIEMLPDKLRELPQCDAQVAVLAGWYAIAEEKEVQTDGSVRVYIFPLSERV